MWELPVCLLWHTLRVLHQFHHSSMREEAPCEIEITITNLNGVYHQLEDTHICPSWCEDQPDSESVRFLQNVFYTFLMCDVTFFPITWCKGVIACEWDHLCSFITISVFSTYFHRISFIYHVDGFQPYTLGNKLYLRYRSTVDTLDELWQGTLIRDIDWSDFFIPRIDPRYRR